MENFQKRLPLRLHFKNLQNQMKKIIALFAVAAMFAACNNSSETATETATEAASAVVDSAASAVTSVVDSAAAVVDSAAGAVIDSAKAKAAEVATDVKEAAKK